jgi:beta-glucanase (GH16 family)
MGTRDLGEVANANYHVYAVEWDTNGIRWFVDGQQFYSVTRAQVQARGAWVFDQPFFLLLNVAVGGTWPGSPDGTSSFPQRMYVDYVRVYR